MNQPLLYLSFMVEPISLFTDAKLQHNVIMTTFLIKKAGGAHAWPAQKQIIFKRYFQHISEILSKIF